MSKILITQEMAHNLKKIRISNNIKAKDIATFIEKTAAYYSKLENGAVKTISLDVFKNILNFITNTNNGYEIFMENLSSTLSKEELKENLAFLNFDSTQRKIPVPEALVDEINIRIDKLNISTESLVAYINNNEDLEKNFLSNHNLSDKDIQNNQWYSYNLITNHSGEEKSFILICLDVEIISNILSKKLYKSNHITMLSIVYHLLKLEHKNDITDDIKFKLQKKATDLLIKHKFYSLSDRTRISRQSKSYEEYQNSLSDFDKNNIEYVTKIISAISFISQYDVKYANNLLEKIATNIESNPSFALRFMATDITGLKNLSKDSKKDYLAKLDTLTNETTENEQKTIELFD